jgi:hypothetical protein
MNLCKRWITCLGRKDSASTRVVVAIAEALRIDTGAQASLHQANEVSRMGSIATAAEECHYPSEASFAALVECDCLSDLVGKCGAITQLDMVGCLQDHACISEKVCPHWQEEMCNAEGRYVGGSGSTMLQGSDLQKRKQHFLTRVSNVSLVNQAVIGEPGQTQTHTTLAAEDALRVRELNRFAASEQEIGLDRRLDSTLQDKCS